MKNVLSIQSHVVFGHAGNSATVFPMQRMGLNVWPLNTVQFSNHTQYQKWQGEAFNSQHLKDVVNGINDIEHLKDCDAILSGYLASVEQGEAIIEIVKKIKNKNPQAVYFCDPVMEHPKKACFVKPSVSEFIKNNLVPIADICAPNLFELEIISGNKITSLNEAKKACTKILNMGPKIILVKHLTNGGQEKISFEMLLINADEAWHISRPLLGFKKEPVGVGDLSSGLVLANFLLGKNLKDNLEHVAAAVYEVMLATQKAGTYELEIIKAQNEIFKPKHIFTAQKI